MSTEWKNLTLEDFDTLAATRLEFHQGIQNVAAVGRKFLPPNKNDEHATLLWYADLHRLAGQWIDGNTRFRSSIDFNTFSVHLVDNAFNSIAQIELHGKYHGQILVWLEEQIAKLGLDTTQLTLNLPYELPKELAKVGKPFALPDPIYATELGKYFHNGDLIAREVQAAFKSTEVRCWPHHFDISTKIIVNNTGNPDTSSYVTVGLSPGDDEINEPYFFASPWPYPPLDELPELTFGHWVDEHWVGAVLTASELLQQPNQYKSVRKFTSDCFSALRKLMTY